MLLHPARIELVPMAAIFSLTLNVKLVRENKYNLIDL